MPSVEASADRTGLGLDPKERHHGRDGLETFPQLRGSSRWPRHRVPRSSATCPGAASPRSVRRRASRRSSRRSTDFSLPHAPGTRRPDHDPLPASSPSVSSRCTSTRAASHQRPDRPDIDLKQLGDLRLGPSMIIDQADNFTLRDGSWSTSWWNRHHRSRSPSSPGSGGSNRAGSVREGLPHCPGSLPGLAARKSAGPGPVTRAHLLGGQAEKRTGRVRPNRFQGAQQPQQRALEDILNLDPPADPRVLFEQLPGQVLEPDPEGADQFIMSRGDRPLSSDREAGPSTLSWRRDRPCHTPQCPARSRSPSRRPDRRPRSGRRLHSTPALSSCSTPPPVEW